MDDDDDNDGWTDTVEKTCATDPLENKSIPADTDSDGVCNYLDEDDDNDGIYDHVDAYPFDSNRYLPEQGEQSYGFIIGILIGIILIMLIFIVKRK